MKNLQNRINANLKHARNLRAQFVAGINARIAHQNQMIEVGDCKALSPEWARALKWAETDAEGSARQIAALGKAFDFAHVCDILPNTTGTDTFIATKVVEKVVKFIDAVFTQSPAHASDYTVQVIFNALKNGGELHLSDVYASLSRRCIGSESSNLATRGNYTKGTAGAQGSQVRELARVLRFAEVNKGKRADVMRIKPERMVELCELFGVTSVEQEQEQEQGAEHAY